ncbi:uncharacterized protein LOC132952680 [Metopolophium dirhodum]|uniref:uncharacterized protein LOC132952680 n=1 Tax=Metopolophium dirhodum TaxID=44670 RepID=UPI00298FF172|nr:uncharacterized protein LOC132952680 [Metopolophium dirhodum]
MIFFKHSLITFTILVIAIWVMPAATSEDKEQTFKESCESILSIIGFKDSYKDFNTKQFKKFVLRYHNILRDATPVSNFCQSTIKENRNYLKNIFDLSKLFIINGI